MNIFYLFLDKFSYKGKKHEKEHEAGLYIVRYAASNVFKINNIEFEIIKNKPHLKNSNIHFSISHSNNIAAVCFDRNPVGFDIEFIKQRDYLSIAERMNFNLKTGVINEFYEKWTQYEAEYKLQKKAKYFFSQIFEDKYVMSIASNTEKYINPVFYKIC